MSRQFFLQAFIDFTGDLTLDGVSELLSKSIFGGIPFTGKNEGLWDEVPAVRLSHDFLGLRVVLGGGEGAYTLEVETIDFDWNHLTEHEKENVIIDMSDSIKNLMSKLTELTVVDIHD